MTTRKLMIPEGLWAIPDPSYIGTAGNNSYPAEKKVWPHKTVTNNYKWSLFQKCLYNTELCSLLWQSDVNKHFESCAESMVTIFKNINWIIWIHSSDLLTHKRWPIDPDMCTDSARFQPWSEHSHVASSPPVHEDQSSLQQSKVTTIAYSLNMMVQSSNYKFPQSL